MNLSFIALQRSLGVKPDGVVGRATLSTLFKRLGAHQAVADELECRNYHQITAPALLIALSVFVYHIVKLEEQGVHQHE